MSSESHGKDSRIGDKKQTNSFLVSAFSQQHMPCESFLLIKTPCVSEHIIGKTDAKKNEKYLNKQRDNSRMSSLQFHLRDKKQKQKAHQS
jgi:hypothetical protein